MKGKKYQFSKIRIDDVLDNKGKSSGFKCITLVDTLNSRCVLLHIYKHPAKDNITNKQKSNKDNFIQMSSHKLTS
mgnify:CR=1 FL=1